MRRQLALLFLALVAVPGCQPTTPGATGTIAPTVVDGMAGLITDLGAAGPAVRAGSTFSSEPVGGQGTIVCVGPEIVRVYEFIDHEAALAASQEIDPEDPTLIGNGVVEWQGRPRFWLRDRVLVLYLGADAGTEGALRSVLGEPFAEADDGFMPLPDPACQ